MTANIYRTQTLALTPTNNRTYKVWLKLPIDGSVLHDAGITTYQVKNPLNEFTCAVCLDEINALNIESRFPSKMYLTAKIIAAKAIIILDKICEKKWLRQRARICAWLIGADLTRIFKPINTLDADDIINVNIGGTNPRWAQNLARNLRNGQHNIRHLEEVNTVVQTMFWCALKACDKLRQDATCDCHHEVYRLEYRFAENYAEHYVNDYYRADETYAVQEIIDDAIFSAFEQAHKQELNTKELASLLAIVAADTTIRVAL